MTIQLEPQPTKAKEFVLVADEPVTVIVSVEYNNLVAHVYRGTDITSQQDPVGAFDSAVKNVRWEVPSVNELALQFGTTLDDLCSVFGDILRGAKIDRQLAEDLLKRCQDTLEGFTTLPGWLEEA